MRNVLKKFIGLLIIGIFFLIFLSNASTLVNGMQTSENPNLSNLRMSYQEVNPIYIDGSATGPGSHNWEWALTQSWCQIIEGAYHISYIEIIGNGSGIGIEIRNSNVAFRICGADVLNCTTGIAISNSSNFEISGVHIFNIYGDNGTDGVNGTNGDEGQPGYDGQEATALMISYSQNITIKYSDIYNVYGGQGGKGGDGSDGVLGDLHGANGGSGGSGGVSTGILFRNSTGITLHGVDITHIEGGSGGDGGDGGNEFGSIYEWAGIGGLGGCGSMGIGMSIFNSTVDMMSICEVSNVSGGNGGNGGNGGDQIGAGNSNSGGNGGDGAHGVGFRLNEGYITIRSTERIDLFGGIGGKGGLMGDGTFGHDGYDGTDSTGVMTYFEGPGGVYSADYYYDPSGMIAVIIGILSIIIGVILLTGFIRGGSKLLERRRDFNDRLNTFRAESSATMHSVKNIPVRNSPVNSIPVESLPVKPIPVKEVPVKGINWLEYAKKFESSGDFEYSLKCIDEALKQNPYSSKAWYQMGEILENLGEIEKGLECYQKAIRYKNQN